MIFELKESICKYSASNNQCCDERPHRSAVSPNAALRILHIFFSSLLNYLYTPVNCFFSSFFAMWKDDEKIVGVANSWLGEGKDDTGLL